MTNEKPRDLPAREHGVTDVPSNVPDDARGGTTAVPHATEPPEWLYRLLVESVRDYAISAQEDQKLRRGSQDFI